MLGRRRTISAAATSRRTTKKATRSHWRTAGMFVMSRVAFDQGLESTICMMNGWSNQRSPIRAVMRWLWWQVIRTWEI
jgi:hypothetical protein